MALNDNNKSSRRPTKLVSRTSAWSFGNVGAEFTGGHPSRNRSHLVEQSRNRI